jgi:regulator of cell morphogenesis and NO signaling
MSDTTMLDLSVNEILRRWPAAVAALNERGIDTCCGGALSLRDAAGAAGIPAAELLEAVEHAIEPAIGRAIAPEATR